MNPLDSPRAEPARPGGGDPFAEFEDDDLDDEVTRINSDNLIAEESTTILHESDASAHLLVESGKDQGKRFSLGEGETTVGRSIDNDVILTDASVSRKHFRVVRTSGDYHFWDLGSGNGTLLNGVRVFDSPLVDGDRLELGESVLRVEAPSAPRSPYSPAILPGTPPVNTAEPAPFGAPTAPPQGDGGYGHEAVHGAGYPHGQMQVPHALPHAEQPVAGPAFVPPPPGSDGFPQGPAFSPPPGPGAGVETPVGALPPAQNSASETKHTFVSSGRALLQKRWFTVLGVAGALVFGLLGAVAAAVFFEPAEKPVQRASADELFQRGTTAMRESRYAQATGIFASIVRDYPGHPGANERLAIARAADRDQRSMSEAERALSQKNWVAAQQRAAAISDRSPLYQVAQRVAGSAEDGMISDELNAGRRALRLGQLDVAREHFEVAARLNAADPDVRRFWSEIEEAQDGSGTSRGTKGIRRRPAGRRPPRRPTGQTRPSVRPPRRPISRTPSAMTQMTTAPVSAAAVNQLIAEARRHGTQSTAGCQVVRRARRSAASNPEVSSLWQQCVTTAQGLYNSAQNRPPSVQRHMLHQVMGIVGTGHPLFNQARGMLSSLPQDEDE